MEEKKKIRDHRVDVLICDVASEPAHLLFSVIFASSRRPPRQSLKCVHTRLIKWIQKIHGSKDKHRVADMQKDMVLERYRRRCRIAR